MLSLYIASRENRLQHHKKKKEGVVINKKSSRPNVKIKIRFRETRKFFR